jgi:O-antigen ligase
MQALYGIMQTLLPFLGVLWDTHAATGQAYRGYARGTFINRNHFAAFLGLVWPLLLGHVLTLKTSRRTDQVQDRREQALILLQKQALGIFCLALVMLALVFSQSRGGILAALFSFTVLYLFAGLRRKRFAGVVAACGVIMLGYGAAIGFEGLANRFQQIEHGAAERMELWQDGWKAVLDHPLTGTGLGTYPEVGRAYQNAFAPGQRASHAHNDYLETVVELGLPAAGDSHCWASGGFGAGGPAGCGAFRKSMDSRPSAPGRSVPGGPWEGTCCTAGWSSTTPSRPIN